MKQSKIIDEFNSNLYCEYCKKVTEHNVQKVDEDGNCNFIGYYGKCDVCNNIKEIEQ